MQIFIHCKTTLHVSGVTAPIITLNYDARKHELNLLTPNDDHSGHTAPLTSKCCILYIYSTNTGTEYFKHGIYCPFFSLQNAICFINLIYLVPLLFTFYIQGVLKLKENYSGAKRLKFYLSANDFYFEDVKTTRVCSRCQ